MRRVHDGRPLAEAACAGEQLDRPDAVLRDALLDLARLLVGVHVQRQLFALGVRAELLEPVGGTRAHGVGRDTDAHARRAQLLELLEVRGDRLLPETVDPTARVRDVEQHELHARSCCRLGGRAPLREPEVVELTDRGEAAPGASPDRPARRTP